MSTNPTGTETSWIGSRMMRKEDLRLVTGQGKYISDIVLPRMAHAMFVRSDYAHAKILSIDTAAAEALSGVICVVTGADIVDEMRSMPQPVLLPNLPAKYPTFYPLSVDKVKFHGAPVALVIARDKYTAEDAAELVEVEYEELTPVVDPEAALEADAPVVNEDHDDNEIFSMTFTGGATQAEQDANDRAVEEIFKNADAVIEERFRVHRTGLTPMEPRGVLCDWSDADGLVAWITTQRPHIDRLALVDLLDIPAEKVRVIAPRDQGGGFGVKAPFFRENVIIAHIARKLGQPVRWIESRYESLMNVGQERDQINYLEIAASNDGKLLALRNRGIADNGTGETGVYWGFVMPFLGAHELPNTYAWGKADIKLRVAVTNKACLTPSRAFGNFSTRFAIERGIDMIAHKIGMEPADVRRKNLIPELPYTSTTGSYYDSGDLIKVWDNLMTHIDLPAFRKEQEVARRDGRYIGIGFSTGVELSGMASEVLVPMENQPGYGAASVRLDPRATVAVFGGDAPGGQGHETAVSQIVAAAFGISPEDTVTTTGDTATTPFGSGTIGARGASYFMSAVHNACVELKDKIARILAHDLNIEATLDDFNFIGGQVFLRSDNTVGKSFRDIVERIIMHPINMPAGEVGGLEATVFFEAPVQMSCFNADLCVVEVNPENGEFNITQWVSSEDVGNVINPMIVDGQMHGAIVQGLSNTMFEQFIYNDQGQQLTADFENYKIANAADMPNIKVTYAPTPCPHTPLGTRGIGEGRPSSIPGALSNAVCDALLPFGIEITDLPLRPDAIWKKIQEANA